MFGGHGGLNYARVAFNDLYCFDLATETWEKIQPKNNAPDGRGGLSLFASDQKVYIYGGWNAEMQYNNIWMFNLETKEWTDPDIYNEIPRWNHCAALVEAIPTWKFFIFGGECAEFQEGTSRSFGSYVNTSCILDLGTLRWNTFASDPELFDNIPTPREYSAMTYDERERRLIIYGGWNNGWFNDLYTLNVAKIVGPSYAITASDPALGQLSGNVQLKVSGRGIKDVNIRVLFTLGNKPVDAPSKLTLEVPGTFVSETELTCITPSFESVGGANVAKECVMQLSIGNGDLTTTWIPFQYFLNTRAKTSLAYGAGLLKGLCAGEPTAFQIVARNDNNENRTSGRDNFAVKIKKTIPVAEDNEDPDAKPQTIEIPCEITDNDNGFYDCKYKCDQDGEIKIYIEFKDDKENMVPIRGSPYIAKFVPGAKPADNLMTGPVMVANFKEELIGLTELMQTKEKAINLKDKDLKNVKALLGVKTEVEGVAKQSDGVTLQIDQLAETMLFFGNHKVSIPKDQTTKFNKLSGSWANIKKLAKDVQKTIKPLVVQENDINNHNIKKLEEDITTFTQEMKKREFFQYSCGAPKAIEKLDGVYSELKIFEDGRDTYGDFADKFGNPELIQKAVKDIEGIKLTIDNMKQLWDHIDIVQKAFSGFMNNKWIETQPFEMEDEVKKLMKTLKDMKVDKRANAYAGILEEIKKWLIFLPLIAELADKAMRDRHWDSIKTKVGVQFTIDDNLLLKDIYDLNLGKFQEDVEEITDQARQEAKMEKTLEKLQDTWKDVCFEFTPHKDSGVQMIRLSEENFDMLEENQVAVTSMFSSRYLSTFEEKINFW